MDLNSILKGEHGFFLISGPCVIDTADETLYIARELKSITDKLGIPLIFKASYDKANRSSLGSFRGPGIELGLDILDKVKRDLGVFILSDVHSEMDIKRSKDSLDIIQIPAFLSRQTDLLVEAARSGKVINIKKGQFMAPWDMESAVNKIKMISPSAKIVLTERGNSFGYNNLVVDFRGLLIMKKLGYPVVLDATHSVQLPGGNGDSSGGNREYAAPLLHAALSIGVNGIFAETHPDPDKAKCDGPNSIKLDDMYSILERGKKLYDIAVS